ncbi:LOW QUALITY PROTEIN: gamma-interferon-inducible lysosomal thiol reductase [Vigna radiata var. radiata]|uniref:LOW QUALITY PROTEIN: gamma-interferon-inducible lysosomal thiol reductase n=1 Tax=Vigna radiata var. radiata TaxID=3916 RepID=A0A1S3V4B7_VIGRR|nr:LOW QUALITY PROTEIN: gamma-interferon-inducible lysosomal thiol reductase [Vigna radiata var. radiata]
MKMHPSVHSFPRSFFFCCFLLLSLFLLLLLLVPPSFSSSSSSAPNQKVTLSLYYESLCPYCADFIVNRLVRLFQTDLISIVNLRLLPWGNAWIAPDGSVICQHGEDECFLNTIQACTITIYPDMKQHFRFVECLERLSLEGRHRQWMNCFQMTGLGTSPIDCYTSGNGKTIDLKYGKETSGLKPPHRFVPWVVVNNQALQEDYRNFETYICRAYKGKVKPNACRSSSLTARTYDESNEKDNNFFIPVCYADEARNLTYTLATRLSSKSPLKLGGNVLFVFMWMSKSFILWK